MDQSVDSISFKVLVDSNAEKGVGFTTDDSVHNSESEMSAEGQGTSNKDVVVKITEEKLFKKFYEVGNENILTKLGRRLFPALMVTVQGLEPDTLYNVAFRVASADRFRYKFIKNKWAKVGVSEVEQNVDRQISLHPYSPKNGESWMKRPISFKNVKFTHNPTSKTELILLHTMHKYAVEIIFTANPGSETAQDIVVPLKYTTFIAVAAYQNVDLIDLKIANNPYANCSNEKLQRELEEDFTSGLPTFPHCNPYLVQMMNPKPCALTPPLAPALNLPMYNPQSLFGVPVPPLILTGTSTTLTSSTAPNLPIYKPISAFGVPLPILSLSGASNVLTSSTATKLPTSNSLPTFGVPLTPLPLTGTSTALASSSTAPKLPIYKPISTFGVPVPILPLSGASNVLTLSTATKLPTSNSLPTFGVPLTPLPLAGTSTALASSSTAPKLPIYKPISTFGVPVPILPLSGTNTIPTSFAVPNIQMYNPHNLPISPHPSFYPIPGYTNLFSPFYLRPPPLGCITTLKTESETVPTTTQK